VPRPQCQKETAPPRSRFAHCLKRVIEIFPS